MSVDCLDNLKVKRFAHEYAISKYPHNPELYAIAYNSYWAGMTYWEAQIIHWHEVYSKMETSTPSTEIKPENAYDLL